LVLANFFKNLQVGSHPEYTVSGSDQQGLHGLTSQHKTKYDRKKGKNELLEKLHFVKAFNTENLLSKKCIRLKFEIIFAIKKCLQIQTGFKRYTNTEEVQHRQVSATE
jgi:hypothetical protein